MYIVIFTVHTFLPVQIQACLSTICQLYVGWKWRKILSSIPQHTIISIDFANYIDIVMENCLVSFFLLEYGFCKCHLEKMKIWSVEHFWLTFFPDQHRSGKKVSKSVQLVRVSFFRSDFLQNLYFKHRLLWVGRLQGFLQIRDHSNKFSLGTNL